MFKSIKASATAEIVEKKSRFIANIFYIESIEEAEKYIKEINKKYYDSRHNCYAYSIYTQNGVVNRFNDDGEPSGTAGGPMLNIITSKGLSNILVVVTRYFGGILLGTGGLVRAYSEATEKVLGQVELVQKDLGVEARFEVTYSDLPKLQYYFDRNNIRIVKKEFGKNVEVIFEIVKENLDKIIKNKENLNFNILKNEILNDKYIEIIL